MNRYKQTEGVVMNRWELEQKIVIRALKDPAFKKQLLLKPKETLREFLKGEKGVDFSLLDRQDVKVTEEKKDEWVLALPQLPKELAALSDAEIEEIFAAENWVPTMEN